MFTISIPTLNRWDLLKPSLMMYVKDFPATKIIVWDNGNQPCDFIHENISYKKATEPPLGGRGANIGVAASWNKLCEEAFNIHHSAYNIILNDDVYLGKKEKDVAEFLTKFPRDFYKSLHDDWCVVALPKKTWQMIGRFDETFFPAYFEDRDYRYRMRICGLSCMENVFFNPFLYRNSQSSERDRTLLNRFEKNKQYYITKWGGEPGWEKWRQPFNGKK